MALSVDTGQGCGAPCSGFHASSMGQLSWSHGFALPVCLAFQLGVSDFFKLYEAVLSRELPDDRNVLIPMLSIR